jgi:hypothetical protein
MSKMMITLEKKMMMSNSSNNGGDNGGDKELHNSRAASLETAFYQ